MKKWLPVLIIGAVTGIGIGAALAQITPTTGTGTDIGTLLQQFGSLFGNGTGTTTTPGTTTGTTTTQPSGGTGERPPFVITNQFNTTHDASLHARSPGVWIQFAIAEHEGTSESLTGDVPAEQPNFYKATFDQIALNVINMITNLITSLNVLAGAAGGLPPPTTTTQPSDGLTTIDNPATSGAGTSTPIQ